MNRKISGCVVLLVSLGLSGCFHKDLLLKEDRKVLEKLTLCGVIHSQTTRKMGNVPLYTYDGQNRCTEVTKPDVLASRGNYLGKSGDSCTTPIDYRPETFFEYCQNNLIRDDYIGNPEAWYRQTQNNGHAETPWTLSQNTRFSLGELNQTQYQRPYLKRIAYRFVDGCELGMQIFKQDPNATALKPVMFIHGGGWRHRGSGAVIGVGVSVPNLTQKGYIVFSPFYRLTGTAGAKACGEASGREILDDIEAAMQWVIDNGTTYGMQQLDPAQPKISVAGQSAGGHLSAYLAVHFPERIERALLIYPATDFGFFIENAKTGGFYDDFRQAKRLIKYFVAGSSVENFDDIDINSPIVQVNNLPEIIVNGLSANPPVEYPPMFMVHGAKDGVAPVEMTTRMCQALNPATPLSDNRYPNQTVSTQCGSARYQMRIIKGADHVMDLKCTEDGIGRLLADRMLGFETCAAGSKKGAAAVKAAMEEAYGSFFP